MTKRPRHRWQAAALNLGVVGALLFALSFLPPDTSLADRQASGVLKFCVPTSYPPLVTGDSAAPGYDIELAAAVADALGLRLLVNVLPSIGRDYNPRNWFLTRAQCDMVGGGVADTVQTRSFMQTVPTEARTGWIGLSASGAMPAAGSAIAVLPGTSGLDRVALSTWLRQQNFRVTPVRTTAELSQALVSGTAAGAITERFVASSLDLDPQAFVPFWIEGAGFTSVPMAIGLWKGDQTLKRAVEQAVRTLENAGSLSQLRRNYGVDAEFF